MRALKEMLELLGYRVRVAFDGADALEKLAASAETIDAILADVVMPRTSGPELARLVAARANAPRVLFMSGYIDDGSLPPGGLPAGSLLIEKPFDMTTLARKIRDALASRVGAKLIE